MSQVPSSSLLLCKPYILSQFPEKHCAALRWLHPEQDPKHWCFYLFISSKVLYYEHNSIYAHLSAYIKSEFKQNFTFSQEYDSRSSASSSVNDRLPHVWTANCTDSSANLTLSLDSVHGNRLSLTCSFMGYDSADGSMIERDQIINISHLPWFHWRRFLYGNKKSFSWPYNSASV